MKTKLSSFGNIPGAHPKPITMTLPVGTYIVTIDEHYLGTLTILVK